MSTNTTAPLAAYGLRKSYGHGDAAVRAVDGIDLELEPGAFVAVMGASGSGKSTLLHLLTGLTDPDAGSVRVGGTDIARLDDRERTRLRRREIGIVFQAFNLVPVLGALDNVALPLVLDGAPRAASRDRAAERLREVGLGDRLEHRPDQLSGGEQQRVAIARALVADPAVVVADEPTGNLDSASTRRICELLARLNRERQRTLLVVTHEPTVARWAQRVVLLRDGRMVDDFATADTGDVATLATRYQQACEPETSAAGEAGS